MRLDELGRVVFYDKPLIKFERLLETYFFVMISPMAMVRRRIGKDPMQRALDPSQRSYRVQSTKSPKEKLERPF